MSDIDLHTINQLSKLLSRYKDDITESGGVIAYSFFIYKSGVDSIIKNYAMQYIHYIYILIYNEIIEKIYSPFASLTQTQSIQDIQDIQDTQLLILYDTTFLSLEEEEFIANFIKINDTIESNTTDEIYPNVDYIEYIYNNCFTLIQEHLHYEYDINNISTSIDDKLVRGKTRGGRDLLITQTQQILDCILIELLQKLCRTRGINNYYRELVCLAITLCNIILYSIDERDVVANSGFWEELMKVDNKLKEDILAIVDKLTSTSISKLLIQIQHITNSCLQSVNINSSRALSVKTIINARAIIAQYFRTTFKFETERFESFTANLLNCLDLDTTYGDPAQGLINYDPELLYTLCNIYKLEDADDANIDVLITCNTLYINFIDEIIALISLLSTTTNLEIDLTYIKDKLNHIILTNKIFRTRETISAKIEFITNKYEENIKNFELNYLSLASKFNYISHSNEQSKLVYTPPLIAHKLVSGLPIGFSLKEIDIIPDTTNIFNTCGVKETSTLTYINPSYENLFCYLSDPP